MPPPRCERSRDPSLGRNAVSYTALYHSKIPQNYRLRAQNKRRVWFDLRRDDTIQNDNVFINKRDKNLSEVWIKFVRSSNIPECQHCFIFRMLKTHVKSKTLNFLDEYCAVGNTIMSHLSLMLCGVSSTIDCSN